jgi:hypothetical protein
MSSQIQIQDHNCLLDNGKPRLNAARSYFLGLRNGDLQGLVDYYESWRDLSEYLVLQNQNFKQDLKTDIKKTIAVKCSKRGNDVYRNRVRKRLDWMNGLQDVRFFKDEDISKGLAKTRMIFFTLTYDTKRCSLMNAWEAIGSEYNIWISRLRSLDPDLSVVRVWQSFGNGFPHIHGVILFKNKEFQVAFKQEDPVLHGRSHVVYRVQDKEIFETSWHSWVDVAACYSLRGALSYCRRYITREVLKGESYSLPMYEGGSQSAQDLALMWIYRKRSFAVSGEFRSRLADLIRLLHNSKAISGQYDLSGDKISEDWICLGIHSASELKVDGSRWFYDLEFSQIDSSWRPIMANGEA